MKMQRLTHNFSWPLRLTGYLLFILFGLLLLPFLPICIWAIYQMEINRRKTKYLMKLNDWAVYNPIKAKSLGVEPNYRAAFNVGGLAGLYLDLTSYNADPLLEEYCKSGGKITRGEVENLSAEQIEFYLLKIKVLDKFSYIGCFITILLILLSIFIYISKR